MNFSNKIIDSKSSNNTKMMFRDMDNINLTQRNVNVDRLLLDRNELFNQNSNQIGEITGENLNDNNTIRGLPIRSKASREKQPFENNSHMDFDLFDNRPSKLNVNYYDPSNSSYTSNFSDISTSMTKMSSQLNPMSICSSKIDKLNNLLFYYLFDISKYGYIVNGFGLFNLFASLYLSSNGMSEMELGKFFEFPKKNELYEGLSKIVFQSSKSHSFVCKNFLLIGDDVPYNPNFTNQIKDFCTVIRLNTQNPVYESNKANNVIKRMLNCDMKAMVTPENLHKLQLMLLTTGVFHPIWKKQFDNITNGIFHFENGNEQMNFLHSIGQSYSYFENSEHRILELKTIDDIGVGFILHNNKIKCDIDHLKIHFYIENMKEHYIDELKIPMISQNFKLRFNNTLQNLGISSIFIKMISPEFFPENISLQDVVQNVKVIFDNTYKQTKQMDNEKKYKSSIKFIVNNPFIFYFRSIKTNTILSMGFYN